MEARPGPAGSAPDDAAPVLIGVGHGSRDPRSAATVAAVMAAVAAARPGKPVRAAFLDLNVPPVDRVLDAVAAAGQHHAVVVPLLLGSAFHARVDLPGLLAAARQRHPLLRVDQAEVLGPDTRLVDALADRVRETIAPEPLGVARAPGPVLANAALAWGAARATTARRGPSRRSSVADLGVIVAAVGASSAAANARTRRVAEELAARTGWRTEICFATADPGVAVARARLLTRGARRLVVAPYFLAPGLLTDRIAAAAPDLGHAAALGAHPALTELIWDRYDAAVAQRHRRSA
ncbi:sirohydrochlorin chelatase [Nocardia jiangsuensis]|uniref:Sirohydrochlorin chelatase n=1 Tax=Nocardia jiangsuensis TaxID=1691563 RepID=A0ABV8E3Y8_9NOCA